MSPSSATNPTTQTRARPLASGRDFTDHSVHRLRGRIAEGRPELLADLTRLVGIPSVSADPTHRHDVAASAETCRRLLQAAGLDAQIVSAGGHPSVIGTRPAPAGAPTVLLYAHHDVQPVGDHLAWTSEPFTATERDGRLYARGAADDKAGVAVHLAAIRAHPGEPPVGVSVLIDGEEEIGSPTLPRLLQEHRQRLCADVIVIADAVNWRVGVPSLTTTLRGLLDLVIDLRTLDHPLHSGAWGGPVPDALATLVAVLASLNNADGGVAVEGLRHSQGQASIDYDEARFRTDAGLLDGVRLNGSGSIADRLWHQPAITITGIDAPSVADAGNTISATARAKISVRLAPGDDPASARTAIEAHLRNHVPHGARLSVSVSTSAPPAVIGPAPRVHDAAVGALRTAWDGTEPIEIGCGGTLPLVDLFQHAFPNAAVLVTGVEDPDTRAHGPNESLHLADFQRACLAEALLLQKLAQCAGRLDWG